ncbi:MAG: cyclic nucleotide-binding domain-containing protein [Patescibacteria group bacterium]
MPIDLSSLSRLGYKPAEPVAAPVEPGVSEGFGERVRKYGLFEGVDEATVSGILSRSRVRRFPQGETVLAEHDACNDEAYVIMCGAVEVSIEGDAFTVLREGSLF